jgi:hypothetical protein
VPVYVRVCGAVDAARVICGCRNQELECGDSSSHMSEKMSIGVTLVESWAKSRGHQLSWSSQYSIRVRLQGGPDGSGANGPASAAGTPAAAGRGQVREFYAKCASVCLWYSIAHSGWPVCFLLCLCEYDVVSIYMAERENTLVPMMAAQTCERKHMLVSVHDPRGQEHRLLVRMPFTDTVASSPSPLYFAAVTAA